MADMTALTNTCYVYNSFMHLRAMLFRPILMHIGIDGYLEARSITYKIDPVVKDKTLTYAMSCISTATSLIDFLYKRFIVVIKSNREWWWNPYRESISTNSPYACIGRQLTWTGKQIPALQASSSSWLRHPQHCGHTPR